jgi:DNA repair protein RadC
LAHNHPGGIAEPSEHDESITTEIQKALALVDISLQDHIILANNEYYSFNEKRNSITMAELTYTQFKTSLMIHY